MLESVMHFAPLSTMQARSRRNVWSPAIQKTSHDALRESAANCYWSGGRATGALLFGGLVELGLPVICIEVCQMNDFAKASFIKNDRRDARLIAQRMRAGLFKVAHVKTDYSQLIRLLLCHRQLAAFKPADRTARNAAPFAATADRSVNPALFLERENPKHGGAYISLDDKAATGPRAGADNIGSPYPCRLPASAQG